jgi:O-antigen/teichoic acid export membrane protein
MMDAASAPRDRPAGAVVRLAWQSAAYSLGNLALKATGLLLLPLYLDPARLAQADYGYLGLIETAAQLAIAVTGLGIASGLLRYATSASEDTETYVSTALLTTLGAAAGTLALILLLAEPLADILLNDAARASIVRWAALYVAFKVIAATPFMLLRVRERVWFYIAALLAEVTLLVGGVWYALARLDAGLEGVMAALAISAGAAAIPLSLLALATVRLRWRREAAVRLLRFGVPLTLAAMAGILLNTGDRFVLEALSGAETLAVYVLAAKFGGLINMLFVQSFNMAFSVLGLKSIASGAETDFHRRVFRHFVAAAGWGVLGVALLTRDVTDLLSPNPAYLAAEPLVLPIAFGFLFYGIYYIIVNVLYAAERTLQVAWLVLGAAVFNLVLNVLLVPHLGAMGAALATLAAYALLAGASLIQARRAMTLRLPWPALLSVSLVVVGCWALAQPTVFWDGGPRLAARLALIAAYPAILVLAGIYSFEELRSVSKAVRAAWRGR